MNINLVYELDGKIALNKYKLVVRHYSNLEKTKYTDAEYFCTDENAKEWAENVIPKHQLLELISKEELDTSSYEWLEGIPLKTEDTAREIAEITAYGSKEAYEASLPEYVDDFMLDMECRMAMIEMGIQ